MQDGGAVARGRGPDLRGGDHAVGALGVVGPLDEEEVVPEVERHLALVPLAVHGPHGLHRVAHLRAGGTAASVSGWEQGGGRGGCATLALGGSGLGGAWADEGSGGR